MTTFRFSALRSMTKLANKLKLSLALPADDFDRVGEADFLIFSSDLNRLDVKEGKIFNRWADPMHLELSEQGYLCYSIGYPDSAIIGPKTTVNILSAGRLFLRSEFRARFFALFQFSKVSRKKTVTNGFAEAYSEILKVMRPKLILGINVPEPLAAAAYTNRIPILELLHSRGSNEPNPKWLSKDETQIPDGVLAYDSTSPRSLLGIMPTLQIAHYRLSHELLLSNQSPMAGKLPPGARSVTQDRRVLFTAGYDEDNPSWPGGVTEQLLDFFDFNETYFLFVRLHPIMLGEPQYRRAIKTIAKLLDGRKNIDSEWASTAPLYTVIREVGCHITWDSLSAYEAADLGLRTYIYHLSPGRMADLTDSGFLIPVSEKNPDWQSMVESDNWQEPHSQSKSSTLSPEEILSFGRLAAEKRWNSIAPGINPPSK